MNRLAETSGATFVRRGGPVRALRFVYRVALFVFPPSLRRRFGSEMVLAFHELANASYRTGGLPALVRVTLRSTLEVIVRADIDPSVLFEVKGPESHTSCMPKITTEVRVKGDITDEQMKKIEDLAHYSPVHGMIEYANTTETKVIRA